MSAKNRPEQAFGSVLLCTGSGVRLILAVGGHDVAEDLAVGRRRPRDSVGACFDGLEDALIRRAAGRNDGHVGVLLADAAHDGRRLRCGGNVEDVRAGADIFNVSAAAETPAVVRRIREQHPDVPIIATGGPTDESILETIKAGANAITWTPPSNGEIFRDIMAAYRENKPHP